MANLLHADSSHAFAQHYANIEASLNRRLSVARAANDARLIALLEQERRQVLHKPFLSRVRQVLAKSFQPLWQGLIDTVRRSSELQVWQSVDELGNYWWCAYDPQTGQSVYAESETEMRLWIQHHQ
jgi:hypothetical protein